MLLYIREDRAPLGAPGRWVRPRHSRPSGRSRRSRHSRHSGRSRCSGRSGRTSPEHIVETPQPLRHFQGLLDLGGGIGKHGGVGACGGRTGATKAPNKADLQSGIGSLFCFVLRPSKRSGACFSPGAALGPRSDSHHTGGAVPVAGKKIFFFRIFFSRQQNTRQQRQHVVRQEGKCNTEHTEHAGHAEHAEHPGHV